MFRRKILPNVSWSVRATCDVGGTGSSSAVSAWRRPMTASWRSVGSTSQASASCSHCWRSRIDAPSPGEPAGTRRRPVASTSVGFSVPSMNPVRSRSWWYGQPTVSSTSVAQPARPGRSCATGRTRRRSRAGQPDDDVVLRRRERVAVLADDRRLEVPDAGGVMAGAMSRHSSGRKPATRLTPPMVVRGSRRPATWRTAVSAVDGSRTSNSRYACDDVPSAKMPVCGEAIPTLRSGPSCHARRAGTLRDHRRANRCASPSPRTRSGRRSRPSRTTPRSTRAAASGSAARPPVEMLQAMCLRPEILRAFGGLRGRRLPGRAARAARQGARDHHGLARERLPVLHQRALRPRRHRRHRRRAAGAHRRSRRRSPRASASPSSTRAPRCSTRTTSRSRSWRS